MAASSQAQAVITSGDGEQTPEQPGSPDKFSPEAGTHTHPLPGEQLLHPIYIPKKPLRTTNPDSLKGENKILGWRGRGEGSGELAQNFSAQGAEGTGNVWGRMEQSCCWSLFLLRARDPCRGTRNFPVGKRQI